MDSRYELVQRHEIEELNSTASLYRHIKTGAELLSLENDDSNKVFGVAFRTPPSDSTGIAHILEHSVLCGSRKYRAKDPFVQLLKGSLQTFLNAITYPDKTVYPVASQNTGDFYNLVDVYLDAVFHPLLTPDVLAQEGWRYDYDLESDSLHYQGVVYNEMKGNYSTADYHVHEAAQNSIFPDITYGHDSGGNPEFISDLDYPSLKCFHENFYHPSNARLFFWGDDDPEERLRIAAEYLDEFEYRAVESDVPLQACVQGPLRIERSYAASQEELDDSRAVVTCLLPDVSDPYAIMEFALLQHLLIGISASPLRRALIDSGLGDDLTGSGLETSTRQMFFSTGLKGVKEEDLEKVEPLIFATLRDIAAQGFDDDLVASAINSLEFGLRENNTGRTPRGLAVFLRTLKTWLHGHDPFEILHYRERLEHMKRICDANPRHFAEMVQRYLLDNGHYSVLTLRPDPDQARREAEREERLLRKIRAEMSADELDEIVAANQRLQSMQETPDSPETLAAIPKLALKDMPRRNQPIPTLVEDCGAGADILHHDIFTNGILYLEVGFDASSLTEDELPYLGLLCDALIDMGTVDDDYATLAKRIGMQTGGIDAGVLIGATRDDASPVRCLQIRGKSVIERARDMMALFRDILLNVDLDKRERMLQIALEAKSDAEDSLLPQGHLIADARLKSKISRTGRCNDLAGGVDMLIALRRIIAMIEDDWPCVRRRLGEVHAKLMRRNGMHCNATVSASEWGGLRGPLEDFCGLFSAERGSSPCVPPEAAPQDELLCAQSQVQYVGKALRVREHGESLHGSELVVVRYLRTAWLWDQIRLRGGAYGAIASLSHFSGVFSMVSYRDPQLDRTLDVYDQTSDYLLNLDIGSDDLERAIIGAIGEIDTYRLPDAKGHVALMRHLAGKSEGYLQRLRDEVLATTTDDFRRFGERISAFGADGTVVILGSEKNLEESEFGRSNPDSARIKLL